MLLALQNNMLLAPAAAVAFSGPSIADFSVSINQPISARDFSSRFSGSLTPITYAAVGTLPAGLSLSSAGVLTGTPTVAGTYAGIIVRATDASANTADSNSFTITVSSASLGIVAVGGGDVSDENLDIGTAEESVYASVVEYLRQ